MMLIKAFRKVLVEMKTSIKLTFRKKDLAGFDQGLPVTVIIIQDNETEEIVRGLKKTIRELTNKKCSD